MSKMGQNPDLGPCTPVNRHRRNPGYHQHPQPCGRHLVASAHPKQGARVYADPGRLGNVGEQLPLHSSIG